MLLFLPYKLISTMKALIPLGREKIRISTVCVTREGIGRYGFAKAIAERFEFNET